MNLEVYVAISLRGVMLFERNLKHVFSRKHNEFQNSKNNYQRHLYAHFEWHEIENICYTKHILCVIVRKNEESKVKRSKYKFKMDGRKSFFAFNLASEHHKFYMKLKNAFVSLKTIADELNFPLIQRANSLRIEVRAADYENIKIDAVVDKPLKSSSANRVRNLKKSMLNDNRLVKLKQRFLRRTKSSAAAVCHQDLELNQNKENECPRGGTSSDIESPSRCRNKVKMGTRVFSSQFLNKSFDSVHDSSFDSVTRGAAIGSCSDINRNFSFTECRKFKQDDDDDTLSIKSTSVESEFFHENELKPLQESSACVIREYISNGCF